MQDDTLCARTPIRRSFKLPVGVLASRDPGGSAPLGSTFAGMTPKRPLIRPPTDPAAWTRPQWSGRLGQLRQRGVSSTDPQIRQCRKGIAYWSVTAALTDQRDALGVDVTDAVQAALHTAVAGTEPCGPIGVAS